MKERERLVAEAKEKEDLLAEENHPEPLRPPNKPAGPVPAIRALIAAAVDRIGTYGDLSNKQQVVALIDEVIHLFFQLLSTFPHYLFHFVSSANWKTGNVHQLRKMLHDMVSILFTEANYLK